MRAMSEYFLKLPGDSQPRSYSEYEVREFLGQGVIDSETLTWKPGMDGWQPVGQALPEKEPETLPFRKEKPDISPPPPTYRLRYSLFELSRLAFPACFILLACSLWTLWIVCFHHIVDYAEVQTTLRQVVDQLPSYVLPLIFLFSLLCIPSLAVQLVWLYRACANVQQFRVSGLRFTPLVSVILSCMPLVGMVLNALIIQELYRASKNPEEWMLQSPSLAVRLYLTAATALTLSLLFPFGVEHYLVAFFLIGSLITAASTLWLISVLQISRMQRELASRQADKLP